MTPGTSTTLPQSLPAKSNGVEDVLKSLSEGLNEMPQSEDDPEDSLKMLLGELEKLDLPEDGKVQFIPKSSSDVTNGSITVEHGNGFLHRPDDWQNDVERLPLPCC